MSRRILLHVALGAIFVVAVVTAVTYRLVFDALKKRDLDQLETYVTERAEREQARFLTVQANLELLRAQYLKRLDLPLSPAYSPERAGDWFHRDPDGAWRSLEKFRDPEMAKKFSSFWAHKEWPATPEMQRQALVALELCDEMLPGWVDIFPSYYFQFAAPGHVNAGVDVELWDWSWKMPADFDSTGLEWMQLALPEKPDPAQFSWTGLQIDEVVTKPQVCVFLPVVKDGVFIASVGHNMPVGFMIEPAASSQIAGASHYIFRRDGRLIAHPTKTAEIASGGGLLTAEACGDPAVASLYRIAIDQGEQRAPRFDPVSQMHYSIARIAGPNWFYVTAMSEAHLQNQASRSARWVLRSGLISLALVLGFLTITVRRQVATPLAELTLAADAMSAGSSRVPLPRIRPDELGVLARAFSGMVEKVAAREADLRQLNLDLEKRVAAQTRNLQVALAHERDLGTMKSRFTSLVSHEFRTPLGIIGTSAQILDRYLPRLAEDELQEHLETIQANVKRMAGMMGDMLVLSRVDSSRMDFRPAALALGDFCRRLIDEVRSAHGGDCTLEIARDAESVPSADETLLRHILTNLLSNAHKYSPAGSPVQLKISRDGGEVIFTVSDRGIGIPEADQAQLFEAFHRAGNVGQISGTGLGLTLVRRCCELHGGSIRVQSREQEGTTFTVRLPLFAAAVPESPGANT